MTPSGSVTVRVAHFPTVDATLARVCTKTVPTNPESGMKEKQPLPARAISTRSGAVSVNVLVYYVNKCTRVPLARVPISTRSGVSSSYPKPKV